LTKKVPSPAAAASETRIVTVTGPAGQSGSGPMSNCQNSPSNVASSVASSVPPEVSTAVTASPSCAPSIRTSPKPQSLRVK